MLDISHTRIPRSRSQTSAESSPRIALLRHSRRAESGGASEGGARRASSDPPVPRAELDDLLLYVVSMFISRERDVRGRAAPLPAALAQGPPHPPPPSHLDGCGASPTMLCSASSSWLSACPSDLVHLRLPAAVPSPRKLGAQVERPRGNRLEADARDGG